MATRILPGDKVKDALSNLTGTAIHVGEFLYGCVRAHVAYEDKDGHPAKMWFDEDQLILKKKGGLPQPIPVVKPGDRVRDTLTSFSGIVTARGTDMHSTMVTLLVTDKDKHGLPVDFWLDENRVTLKKKGAVKWEYDTEPEPVPEPKKRKRTTGGPRDDFPSFSIER